MKYIIANWKANKNMPEVLEWKSAFETQLKLEENLLTSLAQNKVKLIICPSFPFIPLLKSLEELSPNIVIGAQTVSAFVEGAHTGEVTAKSLKGLISHAIVGHSERRQAGETDEALATQILNSQAQDIQPILCVRGPQDAIPSTVTLLAYEPVEAIGTGNNMPSTEVSEKKKSFTLPPNTAFIYGGSVSEETASSYLTNNDIDGLLIGGASLKPDTFLAIARLA